MIRTRQYVETHNPYAPTWDRGWWRCLCSLDCVQRSIDGRCQFCGKQNVAALPVSTLGKGAPQPHFPDGDKPFFGAGGIAPYRMSDELREQQRRSVEAVYRSTAHGLMESPERTRQAQVDAETCSLEELEAAGAIYDGIQQQTLPPPKQLPTIEEMSGSIPGELLNYEGMGMKRPVHYDPASGLPSTADIDRSGLAGTPADKRQASTFPNYKPGPMGQYDDCDCDWCTGRRS